MLLYSSGAAKILLWGGALVLKQGVKYNYETGCHLYVDTDKIIIYGQITQQKLQSTTGLVRYNKTYK